MTTAPEQPRSINPFARTIREAASKQSDPEEAASLLRSAEKVEAADPELQRAISEFEASVERARAAAEELRTRDHLPRWLVVSILAGFGAFLAYVALKHHL